jgi:hypothetical protein
MGSRLHEGRYLSVRALPICHSVLSSVASFLPPGQVFAVWSDEEGVWLQHQFFLASSVLSSLSAVYHSRATQVESPSAIESKAFARLFVCIFVQNVNGEGQRLVSLPFLSDFWIAMFTDVDLSFQDVSVLRAAVGLGAFFLLTDCFDYRFYLDLFEMDALEDQQVQMVRNAFLYLVTVWFPKTYRLLDGDEPLDSYEHLLKTPLLNVAASFLALLRDGVDQQLRQTNVQESLIKELGRYGIPKDDLIEASHTAVRFDDFLGSNNLKLERSGCELITGSEQKPSVKTCLQLFFPF